MMLSVLIHSIPNEVFIENTLKEQGFKAQGDQFSFKDAKASADAEANSEERTVTVRFSPNLSMEEYTQVHDLLVDLIASLQAEYDDSDSLLGYLSDGKGAYILTNWLQWVKFLQKAKFRTLEGNKVRVINEAGKELASGMFVSHQEDDEANITSCTVITLFGERTFEGSQLKIEATNEW